MEEGERLDVTPLLEIDVRQFNLELADAVSEASGAATLSLEDLGGIDWDLVASGALGVTDPIGQLKEWLAQVLSEFVDSIKRAVEALVKPIHEAIDSIAWAIRDIRSTLSTLADTIRGVIVKPLLDALEWVRTTLPRLVDLASQALRSYAKAIEDLPYVVSRFVDAVERLFARLVDRIREGLEWFLDRVAKLPDLARSLYAEITSTFYRLADVIHTGLTRLVDQVSRFADLVRDLAGRVADIFSELTSRIREGLAWFIEQVAKLPGMVRELASAVASIFSELLARVREGLAELVKHLLEIPGVIRDLISAVASLFADLTGRVRDALLLVLDTVRALQGLVRDLASGVAASFAELASRIREGLSWLLDQVSRFPDIVRELAGRVAEAFSELLGRVRDGLAWVAERVAEIPGMVRDLVASIANLFSELAGRVREGFSWFIEQVSRLPVTVSELVGGVAGALADLASRVRDAILLVLDTTRMLQELVRGLASDIAAVFAGLAGRIREGLLLVLDTIHALSEAVRSTLGSIASALVDMFERARAGFAWFLERVAELPRIARDLADVLVAVFSGAVERVKAGLEWLLEAISRVPGLVRELELRVVEVFADLAGRLREGLEWLVNTLERVPDVVRGVVRTLVGDVEAGVGGVVEWVRRGFEQVDKTISTALEGIREWMEAATANLKEVGVAFMGFVNAVLQLPERLAEKLKEAFKSLIDLADAIAKAGAELVKEPFELLKRLVLEPLLRGFRWLWERLVEEWKTLWGALSSALTWLWERLVDTAMALGGAAVKTASRIVEWMLAAVAAVADALATLAGRFADFLFGGGRRTAKDVEKVFIEALKRDVGVAENLWALSSDLVLPFWKATLGPLALRGVVKTFGDVEVIVEPEILGGKLGGARYSVKLSELADAYTRAFEIFYTGYSFGVAMALANTLLVNIQHLYVPRVTAYYQPKVKGILGDILAEEIKEGARVDMFVKPVTETALIDYARRSLALSKGLQDAATLKSLLATIRAYLKIYGLPKWYIEFLTKHPEELMIDFPDRFGVIRKLFLSHVFELPTHSEMARMTQRDVFPGVDVMKRLGWVRGWNEDLTTMIYLLTFRYPSFEKLWQFYMRALAGMLWFKAPETIKMVFDREAIEIKAGAPVSPLDLQKRMAGPDQVKAFETALNTYFKWLEYSNFSWFTDKTAMYGIPIGAEITSKLGGWTADSWLMVDVAADIPTKIDMRWMSRYGIFLLMAERFEAAGVRFESYAPLVEVVPKLLDTSPATAVQVDLTWFSKLLQATGLHPAWVPVVTVAENIMVIADEMTLLRTGWLNLFKEGMLTVDDVERFLAGLLVASYKVGYWDPERKIWTSGWINLPVRWLPHERRLLQLRMAMDRTLDVYREIYGYIRSGIRTLAITPEDALVKLKQLVETLNTHYKKLTKAITGVEMAITLDEEYATMWLELQKLAQDVEAYERVRVWWSRVSGWLLYRVAYGWVTDEELSNLIDSVAKHIPLHPAEIKAYKEIAQAVRSIAAREMIPSPSTLATFAEYLLLPREVVDAVLREYNVPERYRQLWAQYIAVRPVKSDYKSVLTTALRALRYGAIGREVWEELLRLAPEYGFTPVEVGLLQLRADLELAVDEARLWRPSLLTLIGMIEYVPEAAGLLERYRVDPAFRAVVERYARVKPLADEVRVLVNAMYRAKRYITIPAELEEKVLSIARQLGVTDVELALRDLALELQTLVDESRAWVPTPAAVATLAEYVTVPRELVEKALKARRVPEEWASLWIQYIAVRPLKADYRAVLSVALRALRYKAITEDMWKRLLEDATKYGFTKPEVELMRLRAELELAIEEAREYVPTPAMMATLAEHLPEVRVHIKDVFEARRVRGVWAELWAKYIYLRPIVDEVRRWANAMFRLAEHLIIDVKRLEPVFKVLETYGWEKLETEIVARTVLAEQARRAFAEVLGPPRTLTAMSRYTDKAADWAYARAARLIDALPVDQASKELLKQMWKEYIASYQAAPEISGYLSELVTAYGEGVVDDAGLEQELGYIRKFGVPETRLALAKRRAQLRRARVLARRR